MSDPTASAYRLAANYLEGLGSGGAPAINQLRREANRLDAEYDLADDIGGVLMTEAASGCGPLKLGQRALELLSQHYELRSLPQALPADPDPS